MMNEMQFPEWENAQSPQMFNRMLGRGGATPFMGGGAYAQEQQMPQVTGPFAAQKQRLFDQMNQMGPSAPQNSGVFGDPGGFKQNGGINPGGMFDGRGPGPGGYGAGNPAPPENYLQTLYQDSGMRTPPSGPAGGIGMGGPEGLPFPPKANGGINPGGMYDNRGSGDSPYRDMDYGGGGWDNPKPADTDIRQTGGFNLQQPMAPKYQHPAQYYQNPPRFSAARQQQTPNMIGNQQRQMHGPAAGPQAPQQRMSAGKPDMNTQYKNTAPQNPNPSMGYGASPFKWKV